MSFWSVIKKIEDHLIVTLTMVYTLLAVIEVIRRYIFQDSSSWGNELIRYLFIATIYIGCGAAVRYNRHIKIDALIRVFRPRVQLFMIVLNNFLLLLFSVVMIVVGMMWTTSNFHAQISPGLQLPIGYVYALIPLGFLFVSFRLIEQLIYFIKVFRLPENQLKESLEEFAERGL